MKPKLRLLGVLWVAGIGLAFLAGKLSRPEAGEVINGPEVNARSSQVSISPSAALRLDDPGAASQAFSQAVLSLETSKVFQKVFKELLVDRESLRTHDALFLLADAWAVKAPKEAADWLNELDFKDPRNPYLFSAISQWSATDAQEAVDWVMANHGVSGSTRDYLLAGLVRGMATDDPEFALKVLLEAPASPERLGAIEFLTREWMGDGIEVALVKFGKLPTSEVRLRERAIEQMVEQSADEEIDAVKLWASGLSNSSEAGIATTAVAAKWSRKDPEAAASWASGLGDQELRSLAYGEIGTRWARVDPLAAGSWLAGNSGNAEYDLAARAVAWSTVGIDPDRAFSQVADMNSSALREETFEQIGRVWMARQPQEARQYFQGENSIPSSIRERLLQSFE